MPTAPGDRRYLPSDDVLVDVRERGRMLANVADTVQELEEAVLKRSFYISKMIAATAVGLFDAALNALAGADSRRPSRNRPRGPGPSRRA